MDSSEVHATGIVGRENRGLLNTTEQVRDGGSRPRPISPAGTRRCSVGNGLPRSRVYIVESPILSNADLPSVEKWTGTSDRFLSISLDALHGINCCTGRDPEPSTGVTAN